ncbi:MAG: LysM peptidoglycan-binding domain-containing protein [Bacilli bacterium]|nr:LysM peptidoglycan-binding domain-containing protein [Bacilli bacterium]
MFFKYEKNKRSINPSNEVIYFDKYLINNGDTLTKIASKVNSNPNLIASINGINLDDYIYPGDVLLIPKKDFNYYITKEGDTLDLVKNAFDTSMNDLIKNNTTIYLLPGQIMVQKKL